MFAELFRDDVFRLETQRLWLRWPAACDARDLRKYAGNFEVARWTAEIPLSLPADYADRLIAAYRAENLNGTGLHLALSPRAKPRNFIGLISLRPVERRAEIGYWLGEPHWGAGLMKEAVGDLLDLLRRVSDVEVLEAHAMVENARSQNLLRALGFSEIGETLCRARGENLPAIGFRLNLRRA